MEFKKPLVIALACSRSKALEAGDAIASSMQSNAAYGVSQSNDKRFFEFHRVYVACFKRLAFCIIQSIPTPKLNLDRALAMEKRRHYHFIGIGGIGMSALALFLKEKGHHVTGSDLDGNASITALKEKGIVIFPRQCGDGITAATEVIYSSAIAATNEELLWAKRKASACFHRAELLYAIAREKKTVAITGTHGKTSTTALLAHTMESSGCSPSYALGGILQNNGLHVQSGKGAYFIVEADESDGSFLSCFPDAALITNIESDHLDHFGDFKAIEKAFAQFIEQIRDPSLFFWYGDDPVLRALCFSGLCYGEAKRCDLQLTKSRFIDGGARFDCRFRDQHYCDIFFPLPMQHSLFNALAVFGLARTMGVEEEKIRDAFSSFRGVKRRFEQLGEKEGVLFFDDYAHHPTEVQLTLQGFRNAFPHRRLTVLFQPHRHSRLHSCFDQFIRAFDAADLLYVTDTYSAGEKENGGHSVQALIAAIKRRNRLSVDYLPRADCLDALPALLQKGDLLVTMGAGDITNVGRSLVAYPEKEKP